MIDSKAIADMFSALAHPSRVDIFKCLLTCHPNGRQARSLSQEVGLSPSTLSHHLKEMEKGRIIKRITKGTSTITSLDLDNLNGLASVLSQLCCSAAETSSKEQTS